ncbi:MAG TPA: carbohydrate binding domain-containing protein [Candidatus Omnitrophota bacterium]|nr:carbohydrate binding domain-containing protein [Candidatus Omnitrophota bacterium]HRZ67108.1 carbohydrate binding domain-containing protein [Candidatus Omnitrophota bacterium]
MKKSLILTIAILLAIPAAASANLLVNPGFETGNFSGWSPYAFGSEQVSSANPHTGAYEARINNYGWITQTVNSVTPNTAYKLSSYLYMPQDGGEASISITFYNSTGTTSFQQERTWERIPGSAQYEKIETDWLTAPDYTAYARVRCSVASAGSYIDFDDVSLDVIPEPSSLLIFFSGLTGLFGLLSHRKGV